MFNVCMDPEDAQRAMGLPVYSTKSIADTDKAISSKAVQDQTDIRNGGGGNTKNKDEEGPGLGDNNKCTKQNKSQGRMTSLASFNSGPLLKAKNYLMPPRVFNKRKNQKKKTLSQQQYEFLMKKKKSVKNNGLLNDGFVLPNSTHSRLSEIDNHKQYNSSLSDGFQSKIRKRKNNINKTSVIQTLGPVIHSEAIQEVEESEISSSSSSTSKKEEQAKVNAEDGEENPQKEVFDEMLKEFEFIPEPEVSFLIF